MTKVEIPINEGIETKTHKHNFSINKFIKTRLKNENKETIKLPAINK